MCTLYRHSRDNTVRDSDGPKVDRHGHCRCLETLNFRKRWSSFDEDVEVPSIYLFNEDIEVPSTYLTYHRYLTYLGTLPNLTFAGLYHSLHRAEF